MPQALVFTNVWELASRPSASSERMPCRAAWIWHEWRKRSPTTVLLASFSPSQQMAPVRTQRTTVALLSCKKSPKFRLAASQAQWAGRGADQMPEIRCNESTSSTAQTFPLSAKRWRSAVFPFSGGACGLLVFVCNFIGRVRQRSEWLWFVRLANVGHWAMKLTSSPSNERIFFLGTILICWIHCHRELLIKSGRRPWNKVEKGSSW